MSLIQPLQLFLIVPKSIESLFFLINIILISKKFSNLPWKNRPFLYRMFVSGLISWYIYITLDIFIYIFAAYSFETYSPAGQTIIYVGYDLQHPSLLIVNIIRDFAITGAIFMNWQYFIASYSILKGEAKSKHVILNKKIKSIIITIVLLLVYFDRIQVKITDKSLSVNAEWNNASGISLFITIATYIFSAIFLSRTLKSATIDETSTIFRKHIRYLRAGILIMTFGHLYWWILGNLSIYYPTFIGAFNPIVLYYFGHGLWTLSPIFIYLGLRMNFDASK